MVGYRSRYASSPVDLAQYFRGGAGSQGLSSKLMPFSALLQRRFSCGGSNVAKRGNALSGVNRCSWGSIDFQTSLLHPELQTKARGGSEAIVNHRAGSEPRRAQPPRGNRTGSLGIPRLALTASRCAKWVYGSPVPSVRH